MFLREYEWNVDRWRRIGPSLASPTTAVIEGPVSSGFLLARTQLHLLTQHEVFGKDTSSPKVTAVGLQKVSGSFLSDFRDLKPNDHVVHIDHGIACFKGLKKIEVGRTLREFVELVYQGNSKLYVPVDHLHLLQNSAASKSLRNSTAWEVLPGQGPRSGSRNRYVVWPAICSSSMPSVSVQGTCLFT